MLRRAEQPEKVLFDISVRLVGSDTFSRWVLSMKALCEFTRHELAQISSIVHASNGVAPTEPTKVMPVGITRLVKPQLVNAPKLILTTDVGMVTLERAGQSKAKQFEMRK